MYKEPIEAFDKPGHYEIEGWPSYVINKEGNVWSRLRKVYLTPSYCARGYANIALYDDDGYRTSVRRHRLMAKMFIKDDRDVSSLVVNHINGKPGDDRLNNLEWITHQENSLHAVELGNRARRSAPVEYRDVMTGEVRGFPTINACAAALGMTKHNIVYRIRSNGRRVFPELKQYREKTDEPWYIPDNINKIIALTGNIRPITVKNVLTSEVEHFDKMVDACSALGLSPATISTWVREPNQPVFPGFIQLKWGYDETPWREIDDPYLEVEKNTIERFVVTYNPATKEKRIFGSIRKAAEKLKMLATTLNYRIKYNPKKVHRDGLMYMYYSDFIKENFN